MLIARCIPRFRRPPRNGWLLLLVCLGCGGVPPDPGAGPSSIESAETIFADDFESATLSAWTEGFHVARHTIARDASGNHYLVATYPAGRDGGWLTRFLPGRYDALTVSYDVRFPENWIGSTKLVALYGSREDDQWSAFGQAGRCPNGRDFFAAMMVIDAGVDPGPPRFYTYYPAMSREPDGVTCWGRYGNGAETYAPISLSRGAWHRVEFSVTLNTPGQPNARQAFRIDGVERGSWSGFSFRDSDILRLNALQLTFSAHVEREPRELHIDNVSVRIARP